MGFFGLAPAIRHAKYVELWGFGLAPAMTDCNGEMSTILREKFAKLCNNIFLEEVAWDPKVGRSIVTPKSG